jgi:hypothetical protein
VRIAELLDTHDDVMICALVDHQAGFYDEFDKTFLLTLDETVMRQRLTTGHGKLSDTFLPHQQFEASLIAAGANPDGHRNGDSIAS